MKKTTSSLYLLFISLLIASCSGRDPVDIPEHLQEYENLIAYQYRPDTVPVVEFIHETSYGDSDEVLLGRISGVTVDNAGRIFIGDFDLKTIHVFNSDGGYITNIGRSGQGPGEFNFIGNLKATGDYLSLYDVSQRRVNFYSLDSLTYSHQFILNPDNWQNTPYTGDFSTPRAPLVLDNNRFLIGFYQSKGDREFSSVDYHLMDSDGQIISERLVETRDASSGTAYIGDQLMGVPIPFGRTTLMAVADDGRIFKAWTEDFLIEEIGPDGDYRRAIYYPYEKLAMDRQATIETYGARVNNTDFPETWPALNEMIIDDENRLWIELVDESDDIEAWVILNESGEMIGQFSMPVEHTIRQIKNGRIYLTERDEAGLMSIERYRIEF